MPSPAFLIGLVRHTQSFLFCPELKCFNHVSLISILEPAKRGSVQALDNGKDLWLAYWVSYKSPSHQLQSAFVPHLRHQSLLEIAPLSSHASFGTPSDLIPHSRILHLDSILPSIGWTSCRALFDQSLLSALPQGLPYVSMPQFPESPYFAIIENDEFWSS